MKYNTMHYYATFEPKENEIAIFFRDFPEGISCGENEKDAMRMAADCLVTVFDIYADTGRPIPPPSQGQANERAIPVDACSMAKILLHNAMVTQGVNKAELARRLDISPQATGRLTSFLHKSRIENLEKALNALGLGLNLTTSPLHSTP